MRDAGFRADAAVDAAVDAGVQPDAQLADASEPDAGAPDSALADTGTPVDSGVGMDASAIDAGPACPIGIDDTFVATLRVSADDDRRVFVNEVMIDNLNPGRTWHTVKTATVALYRHPARANVIAAQAENYFKIDGLDRGLLLDLTPTSTTVETLVTDAAWRVSSSTVAGYELVAFDDSGWDMAVQQGQHPTSPYGALFGTSSAWWIWFYDSAIPASQKPSQETMLARRKFYVLLGGQLSDTPGPCP